MSTVEDPVFVGSATDFAVTVSVAAVSRMSTSKRPVALISVLNEGSAPVTVQVTFWFELLATTAVNWKESPFATLTGFGLTVTVIAAGGVVGVDGVPPPVGVIGVPGPPEGVDAGDEGFEGVVPLSQPDMASIATAATRSSIIFTVLACPFISKTPFPMTAHWTNHGKMISAPQIGSQRCFSQREI